LISNVSCYTGESSCEAKTEADSSDHTEHSRDDKPRPYLCTSVCRGAFTGKRLLNAVRKNRHWKNLVSVHTVLGFGKVFHLRTDQGTTVRTVHTVFFPGYVPTVRVRHFAVRSPH